MNDQSKMFSQTTCEATPNATSSQESEGGAMPSDSQGGQMMNLFGPGAAPASPSVSPEAEKDSPMIATYGQIGNVSLRSVRLQLSLENRLHQHLLGSYECIVIWNPWDTQLQACLSRPHAVVRNIDGTVYGLWPTLTSNAKAKNGYNQAGNSAGQVAIRKILLAITGKSTGSLHPEFGCWLMGYPQEYLSCAPSETL